MTLEKTIKQSLMPLQAMKRNNMPIHIVTFILLVTNLTNSIVAQPNHGALISFAHTTFDFDTLFQGSDCAATFTYKNTGDMPLYLFDVKTSCGCTIVSWSSQQLLPGDTLNITVKYDTSILGSFQKTILVKSNAVNKPKYILSIKGVIARKVEPSCCGIK